MFKLQNQFKIINICLFFLLLEFLIINNTQIMAAPNEEFVGDMRIINVTVSNIN
ncbi:SVM family protein, partial [Candidatus Phytoplasma sp. Tabriz.2]|nr:SVM family protein [Candidatus Phytoplasma australiense]